jgi:hypothetical protein
MQSVGVIRQLARYPIKSMQGEALPSAALTFQGFEEDRRYAFVQAASRSPFPWLTARELPELLYYRTSVEKAGTPEAVVTVATAHGENWPIDSDDLRKVLEARSGRPLFLLRDYRGSYDCRACLPHQPTNGCAHRGRKRNEGKFMALSSQSADRSEGRRAFRRAAVGRQNSSNWERSANRHH